MAPLTTVVNVGHEAAVYLKGVSDVLLCEIPGCLHFANFDYFLISEIGVIVGFAVVVVASLVDEIRGSVLPVVLEKGFAHGGFADEVAFGDLFVSESRGVFGVECFDGIRVDLGLTVSFTDRSVEVAGLVAGH